jgi:hypothetical protein
MVLYTIGCRFVYNESSLQRPKSAKLKFSGRDYLLATAPGGQTPNFSTNDTPLHHLLRLKIIFLGWTEPARSEKLTLGSQIHNILKIFS